MDLVKYVSAVIARQGSYSIDFAVDLHRRTLSVGFWEGRQFVCLFIVHYGRDVSPTKGYLNLIARLFSATSGDATVICCGGSIAEFPKVLD